jgi:hypothetical protein
MKAAYTLDNHIVQSHGMNFESVKPNKFLPL